MLHKNSVKSWMRWPAVIMGIIFLRIGWIEYERTRPVELRKSPVKTLEKDYMVVVPKSYIHDLESARRFAGQSLWVKAGFRAEYFPLAPNQAIPLASSRLHFLPMEKITVSDVKLLRPDAMHYRPLIFVFERGGALFATIVGFFLEAKDEYQIQLDDLFYLKDPREIYSHWTLETWSKIEAHQLEKTMTFAQVSLSVGDGRFITTEAGGIQLYEFDWKTGGMERMARVRFQEGRVIEIQRSSNMSANIEH